MGDVDEAFKKEAVAMGDEVTDFMKSQRRYNEEVIRLLKDATNVCGALTRKVAMLEIEVERLKEK